MSYDDIFLRFSPEGKPPVEISLRQVSERLSQLGYKVVNREEYDRYMRYQFKQLNQITQNYGGYDTED